MDCVADTHALIWYLYAMPELSAAAKNCISLLAQADAKLNQL